MGIIKQYGTRNRQVRLDRILRKATLACAGSVLLLGAVHAQAATVVTDTAVSQSTQSQFNVPVTFGQVFKAGDVPHGATLTATLNGQLVPLQVDVKATNPDGSLRHAVLTAMLPTLSGGASSALTLATGTASQNGTPMALSKLFATGYDAKASINIGGVTYTASARALLQAANLSNACAPWSPQCNVWLSGPLTSAWVVHGPLTSSNGSAAPGLQVYFAVRAYVGSTPGSVGDVRTDIIVENSNAFAAQVQPQYTATLSSGSASYTSPALTQYTATRWHKVLWWNNVQPQVYLQQNTQYIQSTMAISRYMPLTPDSTFLAGLRQSCAPLDHCDQTPHMGNVGAQAAIGPLPRWTSVYIVDPDVRAYNWMLANTDALGTYSFHYRDSATGFPVSIQKHPYVTIADWGWANQAAKSTSATGQKYKADLLQNCVNNAVVTTCSSHYDTGNPYIWDNAHQPAESYVPYMVTGDWYYMSELAFGASNNELWPNETYRGFSQGLIDGSHGQVRGKAWVLREMADAAWLLPDSYPLKAEFNADVVNSLADWNAKYTNNPNADPLGVMNDGPVYSMNGGHANGIAPWQHDFLTWSAGHAAELGFSGAAAFRNWLSKFEIGLMTDWETHPTGYCWLEATTYNLQVKDASGNWLPSYTAAYAATLPTLAGLACNSPAMVTAVGVLEKQAWQAGEMVGFPYAATGFPANFQIGIAAAADSSLANAQSAWTLFDSRSVKPNGAEAYNDYPNFAVLPRFLTAGTPPPPTEPPPSTPPPSTPPPSTPPPTTPPPATPTTGTKPPPLAIQVAGPFARRVPGTTTASDAARPVPVTTSTQSVSATPKHPVTLLDELAGDRWMSNVRMRVGGFVREYVGCYPSMGMRCASAPASQPRITHAAAQVKTSPAPHVVSTVAHEAPRVQAPVVRKKPVAVVRDAVPSACVHVGGVVVGDCMNRR